MVIADITRPIAFFFIAASNAFVIAVAFCICPVNAKYATFSRVIAVRPAEAMALATFVVVFHIACAIALAFTAMVYEA